MRKVFFSALSIFLLIGLTGCCMFHNWEPATCTTLMTCSKCGKTDGEATGHILSDWEIAEEATFAEPGLKQKVCYVCGEAVEKEMIDVSFIENGLFAFSRLDYIDALNPF